MFNLGRGEKRTTYNITFSFILTFLATPSNPSTPTNIVAPGLSMVGYLIPLNLTQEGGVIQRSPVAEFEDTAETGTTDLSQHFRAN